MATSLFARRVCASAAMVAALTGATYAAGPKTFTAATQADFLKGDLTNLSVDARGQLSLGDRKSTRLNSSH